MHIALRCQSSVFGDMFQGLVTSEETIMVDSTSVERGPCGASYTTHLTDLILITKSDIIPSWAWTVSYLAVVNGLTYPISVVKDSPYIKGLSFDPEYVAHIQLDLLYIPFTNTRIMLSSLFTTPVNIPLTATLELPTTILPSESMLFLAGLYIPPSNIVSDGTTMTVTLSTEVLETIMTPVVGTQESMILKVHELMSHPGSFIVTLPSTAVTTLLPMGKNEHPFYGHPPLYGLPSIDSLGHMLSYRYWSPQETRFRYCHTTPSSWLSITRS